MKIITAACLISAILATAARADIIYFKDGLKTVCQERAWEEDGSVKCEYGGYVIAYDKSDVLRILQTTRPESESTSKPENQPAVVNKRIPNERDAPAGSPAKAKGTVFYDPRRPQKYWASINSKHENYDDAIRALATQYDRPPEWIKANMGDSNDLAQIHRNLAASNPELSSSDRIIETEPAPISKQPVKQPKKEPVTQPKKEPVTQSKIEFYNPRRPSPYWTSAADKHKSFKDAIRSLAETYNRSPQWVQENMGKTNDLSEIHSNLRDRQMKESAE